MATVSIQPSPHALSNMNSRRAPLRDAPNSVLNSPLRGASTALVGAKRSRPFALDQRDLAYQQGPPIKKQAVDLDAGDPKGLLRKTGHNPPTALQRKLEAVRDARDARAPRAEAVKKQPPRGDVDTIRQWQRHYKKVFPGIKFYFDNIPGDIHTKLSSQVRSLGAVCISYPAFLLLSLTKIVVERGSFLFQCHNSCCHYASNTLCRSRFFKFYS
jgi:regulatory subunit for Cdc7p protein kinase